MADDVLRITRSRGLQGLILAGEIDESSYPALVRGLAALDPGCDVHVDLGEVDYCDLAGLRAIVCAGVTGDDYPGNAGPAGPGPGRGGLAGRVVLHAVPPRLRKILQILGWDVLPGLVFDEQSLPGGRNPVGLPSGS